jgi:hypothetical protein
MGLWSLDIQTALTDAAPSNSVYLKAPHPPFIVGPYRISLGIKLPYIQMKRWTASDCSRYSECIIFAFFAYK